MRTEGRLAAFCGGRREGRPALLDDLPGRQRLRPKTGEAGDLGPDRLRQSLAGLTEEAISAADRHRQAVGEGEQPLAESADEAGDGRRAGRRRSLEMRVDDGPERRRHREVRHEVGGDPGRHREHDRVVRSESDAYVAEIEPLHRVSGETEGPQAATEMHRRTRRCQVAQGRVDEGGRQAGARDEGMAGLSAGRQRLAQELRGEPCRGFVRFGVKGGEQDRAP